MDYPKSDPTVGLVGGKFTDGDPAGAVAPSRDPAAWANLLTDELLNAITAFGVTPDEANNHQLIDALLANLAPILGSASQIFRVAQAVGANDATPLSQVQSLIAAGEAEATLTDQATITWDWATQGNAKLTIGGNRTLAAPSNLTAGRYAAIRIVQDATGGRVLTFTSNYKGVVDVPFSTSANAVDWLLFRAVDGTNCELVGYRTGVSA